MGADAGAPSSMLKDVPSIDMDDIDFEPADLIECSLFGDLYVALTELFMTRLR